MARSRTLSPLFWEDTDLAQCSLRARLLLLGLLNLADREGRLKDSAPWIKAKIFPYEDVKLDDQLNELAADREESDGPFILRYKVDGKRYIQIRNFCKYQNPHPREVASQIPAPEEDSNGEHLGATRVQPRFDQGKTKALSSNANTSVSSSPSVSSVTSKPSGKDHDNGLPRTEKEIARAYLSVMNAMEGRRLTTLSPDVVKKVRARLKDWSPCEVVATPLVVWATHTNTRNARNSPEVYLRDGESPKTRNGQTHGGYYWMSRAYEKADSTELTKFAASVARKADEKYGLEIEAMLRRKGFAFPEGVE